jgi:hypothetical protein
MCESPESQKQFQEFMKGLNDDQKNRVKEWVKNVDPEVHAKIEGTESHDEKVKHFAELMKNQTDEKRKEFKELLTDIDSEGAQKIFAHSTCDDGSCKPHRGGRGNCCGSGGCC